MVTANALSLAEIEAFDPRAQRRGERLRVRCPVHGGDHQRSLSVDLASGLYHCFQCRASGLLQEFRFTRTSSNRPLESSRKPPERPKRREPVSIAPQPISQLSEALERAQRVFSDSPAAVYCTARGIPPDLARQYGAGYTPHWRGRPDPRVVFPLAGPEGLLNVYARAISPSCPRERAHRFLPGPKGLFNYPVLEQSERVFITEGVFDALALIAAGHPNVVALCGVRDFKLAWFRRQQALHLCLDADGAGAEGVREIAHQAIQLGMRVTYLPREQLAGYKDLSACWQATGQLRLD